MYYILDTETTGTKNPPADQVIELAYININPQYPFDIVSKSCERYNPSVPISPHATAVHNITKRDLIKCRPSKDITLPAAMKYLIAHNAAFDKRMLGTAMREDINVICSMKLLKSLEKFAGQKYPVENYKLPTIFNYFYPEEKEWLQHNAHSALGDCIMLHKVLQKCLLPVQHMQSLDKMFEILIK